jgi:hypothetical protein
MRTSDLALGLAAALLAGVPAMAQGLDGTWQGRIRCEAAGSLGPLSAPIKITVAGTQARYERPVMNPADTSKVLATETGGGTLSPDGQVRMSGTVGGATWRQDTVISGRMTRPGTTLGGNVTTFNRGNNAGVERRCTITVTPG